MRTRKHICHFSSASSRTSYRLLWLDTSSLRIKKLEPRSQVSHCFVSWRVTACTRKTERERQVVKTLYNVPLECANKMLYLYTFTPARTIFFAAKNESESFNVKLASRVHIRHVPEVQSDILNCGVPISIPSAPIPLRKTEDWAIWCMALSPRTYRWRLDTGEAEWRMSPGNREGFERSKLITPIISDCSLPLCVRHVLLRWDTKTAPGDDVPAQQTRL